MSKSNRKAAPQYTPYRSGATSPSESSYSSSSQSEDELSEEILLKDYGTVVLASDLQQQHSTPTTPAPTQAAQEKLSLVTEKELVTAIQSLGGLDTFSLRKLLGEEPDLYFVKGNPTLSAKNKRTIQNRVDWWKHNDQGRKRFKALARFYEQEIQKTPSTTKTKKPHSKTPTPASPSPSLSSPPPSTFISPGLESLIMSGRGHLPHGCKCQVCMKSNVVRNLSSHSFLLVVCSAGKCRQGRD
jgi:hypothetical protein